MNDETLRLTPNLKRFLRPLAGALLCTLVALPTFAEEKTVDSEGGGEYLEKLTGLQLHGFANMGWAYDTSTDNHRKYSRDFYLNNFDVYFNPDLGNRARFLAELVFEPDAESQQPTIDAERLQAGYVVSKYLTAWIGRFHTPLGYYVISYHHGMQLQTAVEKPRFVDFEDHYGVLPVHSNGIWLNGNFTLGEQRFALMGWVSNSDRLVTDSDGFTSLDFDMARNDNHKLAYGARLNWVAGGKLDGLQVGTTVLSEQIDYMGGGDVSYGANGGTVDNGNANQNVGQPQGNPSSNVWDNTNGNIYKNGTFSSNFLLYGLHAVYEAHGIEFLNEFYGFHNSDVLHPGPSWDSYAGFSQLAYWINGISAPFVRFERAFFNQNDPYFLSQYNGLPYTKYALGYRYNLNDSSALKLELSRTSFNAHSNTNSGQAYNDVHFDYSIRF